jgi:energy-coupling factor transporter ATP-binding protein EcfA2
MMAVMAMVLGEGEPAAGPWQVMPLTQLADMLIPDPGVGLGRPRIVAVDGRSGSGKTTLAARIQGAVPASAVVHTDDIAWKQAMFDWAGLLTSGILEPVHRGEPVSYRPPAWREHNRDGAIEIPPDCDLVVIEGAGAARRELMALVDTVIWVQSDPAEAERRGIERDGGDRAATAFWHLWMAEELPFMARQQPWTRAGIIIAGTPTIPHNPATEIVIAQPPQPAAGRTASAPDGLGQPIWASPGCPRRRLVWRS